MDILKQLITSLNPLLIKQIGLNKKGNNFYLEVNKNYGIINFQKSKDSTKEVVYFTINFGIYSNVLGRLQYNHNSNIIPKVEHCHWQSRVGNFMPDCPDYWWKVDISDDLNKITSVVIEAVQKIIMPEINERLTDEGLINCWINETFAGTTEISRFKYLTILLKEKGDFNVLNQVIETFIQKSKGKQNADIAIEHLKEIGYSE